MFEFEETASFINSKGYKKISLQFPDELLKYATYVVESLTPLCDKTCDFYVLGDTSYGSCCVDVVAAQHVVADVIIHYGISCLSDVVNNTPVFYVFCDNNYNNNETDNNNNNNNNNNGKEKDLCKYLLSNHNNIIDCSGIIIVGPSNSTDFLVNLMEEFIINNQHNNSNQSILVGLPSSLSKFNKSGSQLEKILLTSTPASKRFREFHSNVLFGRTLYQLINSNNSNNNNNNVENENIIDINSNWAILFVGDETLDMTHITLVHNDKKCFWYQPPNNNQNLPIKLNPIGNSNNNNSNSQLLMRRYFLVEKAKTATTFGILVGTLGISEHKATIQWIRDVLDSCTKQHYTIVIGKINACKLGNFPELDMYVLVSCPVNSLLDSKDFFKPVITPFELMLSLTNDSWPTSLEYDFRKVFNNPKFSVKETRKAHLQNYSNNSDDDNINNNNNNNNNNNMDNNHQLVNVSGERSLTEFKSAGASYLATRSFQGLNKERLIATDENTTVQQGRKGRARDYNQSPSSTSSY